ncbi:hypothetical protein [Candidatus Oscillochloris fontis]|uniref:hypothetical protein n=1 Tax=Candidatus Oscillochloris fontis TaxID=2496868 RepID=UPI00101E0A88|nr:hypothetical protein [Candidatus Oscillochloris fontis]
MINQPDLRLIQAIMAATHIKEHELDREAAEAALAEYVERELAGEAVLETLPLVAFYIATDADMAHQYAELRADLIAFAQEELPEIAFDMAAAQARVARLIEIAPDDIVRPLPTTPPQESEQDYLRRLFPIWQRSLPVYGGVFMSGTAHPVLQPVDVPDQATPTQIDVVFGQQETGAVINGRLKPRRSDLVGVPVRLYRIEMQPQPTPICVAEVPLDRFGRFAFDHLPSDRYVIALFIEQQLIGVVWVDL